MYLSEKQVVTTIFQNVNTYLLPGMNVCDQFPPVVGTLASVVTEEHGDRVHGEHAEVGAASEALHRGGSGQVLQLVFIGYSTLKSMTLPFFLRNLMGNNQKQHILDIFL